MSSVTTPTDTGESGLQAMIAKNNITMTTQYLGPNAIDNDENQWLVTLRRGDGRVWTTRVWGTTEELCASLRSAESAETSACEEILTLMFDEIRFAESEFDCFFEEYSADEEQVPTPWDHMFHKYILAQTEGLVQFMEGIDCF